MKRILRMRRIVLLCTVGAAVATGILLVWGITAEQAQAAFPGKNGKIVFSKTTWNSQDIYTIDPSSGSIRNLLKDTNLDSSFQPSTLPTGKGSHSLQVAVLVSIA